MYIQLTEPFRGKKTGDRIHWPAQAAQNLIDAGKAVEVEEHAPVIKEQKPVKDKMQRKAATK